MEWKYVEVCRTKPSPEHSYRKSPELTGFTCAWVEAAETSRHQDHPHCLQLWGSLVHCHKSKTFSWNTLDSIQKSPVEEDVVLHAYSRAVDPAWQQHSGLHCLEGAKPGKFCPSRILSGDSLLLWRIQHNVWHTMTASEHYLNNILLVSICKMNFHPSSPLILTIAPWASWYKNPHCGSLECYSPNNSSPSSCWTYYKIALPGIFGVRGGQETCTDQWNVSSMMWVTSRWKL